MQFPLDEQTVWHAAQPGSRRLNAICQIEGKETHFPLKYLIVRMEQSHALFINCTTADAGYRLIEEEQEVEAAPVYAVGSLDSQPVQVTRRVVIYRQSEAVTKVFGMEEVDPLDDVVANDDDVGGGAVAVKGQTPLMAAAAEEKKEKTKKKKKERKEEEDEEDEPPQKKKKSKKKK